MQIELGCLAEKLTVQTGCNSDEMQLLDRDQSAITRCHIRGFMPKAQYMWALKKLVKKVEKALKNEAKKLGR